ncbi:MAG: hypothetical protein CMO55_01100 [Verrucomicrobiales bacterium]|nr:hypothetical protein [Verrucomicrobiales bacterium]
MSQMHQMQLTYVPTEDRVLFRLNTKARQEFRFWMTRRYSEILWNTLTKILNEAEQNREGPSETPEPPIQKDTLVESAKQEIKHKEVVSQSDFKTQYQESSYLPLGEEPALLFSVGVKPNPSGQAMLCMHPEKGQGIEMVLNEQILHSLCKLLQETTHKANWKLDLKFVPPGDANEDPQAGLN